MLLKAKMDIPEYDEADENPMDAGGYEESMQDTDDIIEDTDIFNSNEMEMEIDEDKKSEGLNFSKIILQKMRF